MGWEKSAHIVCRKPFTGHFRKIGSVWRCRKCGGRWMISDRRDVNEIDTVTTWIRLEEKDGLD